MLLNNFKINIVLIVVSLFIMDNSKTHAFSPIV